VSIFVVVLFDFEVLAYQPAFFLLNLRLLSSSALQMCFFKLLQTLFICPVKQTNPITSWILLSVRKGIFPLVQCFMQWRPNRTRSSCNCTQCGILFCTWLPAYCVCVCVRISTELHSFISFMPYSPFYPSLSVFEPNVFFSWLEECTDKPVFCSLCITAVNVLCTVIGLPSLKFLLHSAWRTWWMSTCFYDVWFSVTFATWTCYCYSLGVWNYLLFPVWEWVFVSWAASNLFQNLNGQIGYTLQQGSFC